MDLIPKYVELIYGGNYHTLVYEQCSLKNKKSHVWSQEKVSVLLKNFELLKLLDFFDGW